MERDPVRNRRPWQGNACRRGIHLDISDGRSLAAGDRRKQGIRRGLLVSLVRRWRVLLRGGGADRRDVLRATPGGSRSRRPTNADLAFHWQSQHNSPVGSRRLASASSSSLVPVPHAATVCASPPGQPEPSSDQSGDEYDHGQYEVDQDEKLGNTHARKPTTRSTRREF